MAQLINAIISGNLTLTGKLNGYNIGSAIEKNVDTSISANSTNVPTSAAIISYVTTAINNWKTANTFNSVTTATNSSDSQVTDVVVPNGYTTGFHQALPKGWATTSATAAVTASAISISWQSNAFKATGTLTASGTANATITPGYILANNKTQNAISTGTATWTGNTISTVGTDVSFSSGSTILKPVIDDVISSINNKTRVSLTPQTSQSILTTYYISVGSSANTTELTAYPSVSSAGYGTADHYNSTNRKKVVGAAESDVTYLPIPTAQVSLSLSGSPSPTLSNKSLSVSDCEQIACSPVISNNSSNWTAGSRHFYLGIEAATVEGTVDVTPTLSQAGYIGAVSELPAFATLSGNSANYYVPLKTGSLSAATKAEAENSGGTYYSFPVYNSTNFTYLPADAPAVAAEGYLIINEGYYKNAKISLGQLIGDIESGDATSSDMLVGTKAYNENGVLMTGTIPRYNPNYYYYTTENTGLGKIDFHSYTDINQDVYIIPGRFTDQFTTTSTAGSNLQINTTGWLEGTYLDTITLPNNKQIKLNDGINTWVISKDSSGNVTVS